MSVMKYIMEPAGFLGRIFVRSTNSGHNRLTQWGLSHLEIGVIDIVLDVGCGGCRTVNRLAMIAKAGKVWGIDYSDASVASSTCTNKELIGEGRVEISKASVSFLLFPSDMFDLVTSVETCYFWPDFQYDLKEINRVLKPVGMVVLTNETYKEARFEKRNLALA